MPSRSPPLARSIAACTTGVLAVLRGLGFCGSIRFLSQNARPDRISNSLLAENRQRSRALTDGRIGTIDRVSMLNIRPNFRRKIQGPFADAEFEAEVRRIRAANVKILRIRVVLYLSCQH